jgi:hypothetical protein
MSAQTSANRAFSLQITLSPGSSIDRGTRRNAHHTESQNLAFKKQQPNHTKGDSAVSIINNVFNNFHPLPYYVEEVLVIIGD